ncbi:hypothetical protein WDU94_001580 [Cyamophila willieti]
MSEAKRRRLNKSHAPSEGTMIPGEPNEAMFGIDSLSNRICEEKSKRKSATKETKHGINLICDNTGNNMDKSTRNGMGKPGPRESNAGDITSQTSALQDGPIRIIPFEHDVTFQDKDLQNLRPSLWSLIGDDSDSDDGVEILRTKPNFLEAGFYDSMVSVPGPMTPDMEGEKLAMPCEKKEAEKVQKTKQVGNDHQTLEVLMVQAAMDFKHELP